MFLPTYFSEPSSGRLQEVERSLRFSKIKRFWKKFRKRKGRLKLLYATFMGLIVSLLSDFVCCSD